MPVLVGFLCLSLIEIAVFALVGDLIGVGATLLLVIASAIIGVLLIRYQGVAMVRRAVDSLNRREVPLKAAFDGIAVALGGVLFVMPGFVTDVLGLVLVLPPVRAALWRLLTTQLARFVRVRPAQPSDVIEGDYRRVEPERLRGP